MYDSAAALCSAHRRGFVRSIASCASDSEIDERILDTFVDELLPVTGCASLRGIHAEGASARAKLLALTLVEVVGDFSALAAASKHRVAQLNKFQASDLSSVE